MKIGNQEIKEIIITTTNDELVATITDENIVNDKDYVIKCIPI